MLEKWNKKVIAKVDEYIWDESAEYLEELLPDTMRTPCHTLSFMINEKIGYFLAGGNSLIRMIKDHIRGLGFGNLLSARECVSEWLEMSEAETAVHGNEWFEETYLELVSKRLRVLAQKSVAPEGWDVTFEAHRGTSDRRDPRGCVTIWMDGMTCATCWCCNGHRPAWALYCVILDSIVDSGRPPEAFVGNYMCSGTEVEEAMESWCKRAYPHLAATESCVDLNGRSPQLIADALCSLSEMLNDDGLSEPIRKLTVGIAISMLDKKLNAA